MSGAGMTRTSRAAITIAQCVTVGAMLACAMAADMFTMLAVLAVSAVNGGIWAFLASR